MIHQALPSKSISWKSHNRLSLSLSPYHIYYGFTRTMTHIRVFQKLESKTKINVTREFLVIRAF